MSNASTVDPATVPLGPPPPGKTSDFSNPGFSNTIKDLCIVLVVLNTLFTLIRVYTKVYALKSFGWDDAFCVLAWVTTSVEIALNIVITKYGFGRHIWDTPATDAGPLFKILFVIETLSDITYASLKLTFLLTYFRIFGTSRPTRWFIQGGAVVCSLYYFAGFWYEIFKCHPIAKSWNPALPGTCLQTFVPGALTGVFNVISDIYILILPIPVCAKLHMSLGRRLRVLAVFSVGAFTAAASIVRLVETIEQVDNPDATYTIGRVAVWANLEYSIGLMVACTLMFPAFWNHVLRDALTDSWYFASTAYRSVLSMRHASSGGLSHADTPSPSSGPEPMRNQETVEVSDKGYTVHNELGI